MIKEAIIKLSKKQDLAYAEAEAVMDEIMSGQATPVQMSAYLTALALKGETIDEITASAAGMRAHCIKLLHNLDVLEIVGTGGDGSNSFNISTTSSLVIAAGGVPVAKHGNRAASSKSGAADVLETLGVKITLTPERSAEILKKINICFLFAQNYHIAMKYVAPIRKELGIRTVFNILGPLSNPAGANMELMGVYDQSLVEPLAQVMANLGVNRGMVVYGQDSLDEISMCAPTSVCEIRDGKFTSLFCKWHVELSKQFACLFICFSSSNEDDIHTSYLIYFIVFDFWEDQLLFNSESVVTSSVECVRIYTSEVTYTWECKVNQTVNEFIHLFSS